MKYFITILILACCLQASFDTTAQTIMKKKPLVGIFDGRTPNTTLSALLKVKSPPDRIKVKWRMALYKDAVTGKPDGYQIWYTYDRSHPREGQWHILKGTKANPEAVVYRLDAADEPSLYLQKMDDNVLFFIDADGNLLVGNRDFSYALNRVTKKDEQRLMATAQ